MRCVLAIDSGGTKCHVILVRDDGQLLGWGRSGPGQGQGESVSYGRGRSHRVMLYTIKEALGSTDYEELHIGAVGQFPPEFLIKNRRPTRLQVHQITEPMAAFRLVGQTYGVCALAGPGAFVHGRTRDGRFRHLDGLGPLLGDHGGGYDIGLRAIQAVAKSGWHPRHRVTFANEVFDACGGHRNDPYGQSLIAYMAVLHDRSEIAQFARLVVKAAANGDEVAQNILRDAATSLAATVYDLVDQLQMAGEEYSLVGTGGVITGSDLYWEHLCSEVKTFAPRFQPLRSDLPAVVGVALATLGRMAEVDFEAARGRLCGCVRAKLESITLAESQA